MQNFHHGLPLTPISCGSFISCLVVFLSSKRACPSPTNFSDFSDGSSRSISTSRPQQKPHTTQHDFLKCRPRNLEFRSKVRRGAHPPFHPPTKTNANRNRHFPRPSAHIPSHPDRLDQRFRNEIFYCAGERATGLTHSSIHNHAHFKLPYL